MSEIIKAPWTKEQVKILQKYQDNWNVHPYTCECGESLVPALEGWECEACQYKQDWFYETTLEMFDRKCPLRKALAESARIADVLDEIQAA